MKTTTARTEKEKGSMVILTFFFLVSSCLFVEEVLKILCPSGESMKDTETCSDPVRSTGFRWLTTRKKKDRPGRREKRKRSRIDRAYG